MLILSISLIGSKDYSVTFFLKSSVTHPSFIIKGQPVKEGETYTISDSEKIYTDFDDSDNFEVKSVQIRTYYDGEYNPNQIINIPLVKEEGSLSYFTIGNISGAQDISIEGLPEYKSLNLDLKTIIDGRTAETGEWLINENKSIAPYSVLAMEDFYVSYEFDASKYYLLEASPSKKVLTDSEDTVIFMQEKSSSPNRNTEYSVILKPYTNISITKDRHVSDVLYENETIMSNISDIKFRNGDELTIVSDRDFSVDESCGLDIVDVTYVGDQRETKLRIPVDSTRYEYNISVIEQKKSHLTIRLSYHDIAPEKIRSIFNKLNFSLKIGGKEVVNYDKLVENGFLQIEVKEDSFFSLYLDKPSKDLKISYKVKSDSIGQREKIDDVQEKLNRSYDYKIIKQENLEVEMSITEGFRLIPEAIINDDNIGTVIYYYNSSPIEKQIFIPFGSTVNIRVYDVPETKELTNRGQVIEKEGSLGTIEIPIDENTSLDDFEIKARDIAFFYVDPAKYIDLFNNGTVDIQIRKKGESEYKTMEGKTLVVNGDSVKLVDTPNEGYVFQSYNSPERSEFYAIEDFEYWIKNFNFVIEEETYTTVGELPQPDFWSVTYKYDSENGEEVKVGDFTKKDRTVVCCYSAPMGFSCPDDDRIKTQKTTVGKLPVFKPKSYTELEWNKPQLKLELKGSNYNKEFSVDVKYANSSEAIFTLNKKNAKYSNEKISTASPLVLEFYNFITQGKALEITVDVKLRDGKEETKTFRTTATHVFDKLDVFASNENGCPVSSINITINVIDATLFNLPYIENATIKVLYNNKELENGNPMKNNDQVHVKITPDNGYYIDGTNSDDYSYEFDKQYSQIEAEINKHQAIELVKVYLPDYQDIGLSYKVGNKIVEPGWQSFMLGERIYYNIESGKEGNFEIINNFKYINVDTVFNNFFGTTANSNYAYVITKDSYNKTLTLEDFNCREKGNK